MEIEIKKIEDITPANYNPRLDLQKGDPEYEKIKNSILKFGLVEPIVWNEVTGNIVGGHQRFKVMQELGHEEIPVSVVALSEMEEKALNIALNKVGGGWDNDALIKILEELEKSDIGIDITGFDQEEYDLLLGNFNDDDVGEKDYTDKIKAPVYEMVEDEPPETTELFDDSKSIDMIYDINNADIPKEIKEFLTIASYRHIIFDYAMIAEFYAHADMETQDLMERSALVIIDYNKAIEYGFTEFTQNVLNEVYATNEEE